VGGGGNGNVREKKNIPPEAIFNEELGWREKGNIKREPMKKRGMESRMRLGT